MNCFKKILAGVAVAAAAFTASAKPSVLQIAQHINDSTIVFPESVETDTHKMMQNWYLQTYTALDQNADSRPDVEISDEELIKRLGAIPTTIEMPYNSVVRQYIDLYTQRRRSLVETMLGMSLYYMPIFEEALERQGLPHELKYLPIIESALDPDAVSRAGATGLWQLMLPTARGLGMEVNTLVDERRDPIRSTEAATKFLRQLYDIYNDWSLAIAAYNCGPGNVNKALRRAGASENNPEKKDFWAIYPYLPRETRGYVPGFIAATYVMTYYNKHNISPALAKRPILTDSVHVNRRVHFQQISDILQIPVEELKILNPQYRQQVIPGDIREYSLVLPANQIYSYIMSEDAIVEHDANKYARREVVEPASETSPATVDSDNSQPGEWVTTEQVRYHTVKKGETMASIAQRYGVTLWSLKHANGNISKARRGQKLKVVTTKRVYKPAATPGQPADDDKLLVKNNETPASAEGNSIVPPDNSENDTTASGTDMRQEPEGTENSQARSSVSENVAGSFQASQKKQQAAKAEAAKKTKAKKDNAAKSKTAKSKKKKNTSKTVTVKPGDSLSRIAKRNGTTVKELQRLNGKKGNNLQPGDKIRVK